MQARQQDRPGQLDAFTQDLLALIARGNLAQDGTLVLPSDYLEVVITRS